MVQNKVYVNGNEHIVVLQTPGRDQNSNYLATKPHGSLPCGTLYFCIWVTNSLEGYLFCTKVYFLVYCSIHSYPPLWEILYITQHSFSVTKYLFSLALTFT